MCKLATGLLTGVLSVECWENNGYPSKTEKGYPNRTEKGYTSKPEQEKKKTESDEQFVVAVVDTPKKDPPAPAPENQNGLH